MAVRSRSLGLGSTTIIAGDTKYGYYGKYKGIITPNELISLAGITQGTTKNDNYTNPNDYITWLKFSHNYKTLFVADRTIRYGVSWNHLNDLGLIFGKVVDIKGQKYLLRVLQGANCNPSNCSTDSEINNNNEWNSLIGQFTPNTSDSHFKYNDPVNLNSQGSASICQETYNGDMDEFLSNDAFFVGVMSRTRSSKNSTTSEKGYRPVLEVI